MASVVDEVIPAALDGERLDRVVAMLSGCSRSEAKELIAAGSVNVDGASRSSRVTRVNAGMRVTFEFHAAETALPAAESQIEFEVIHSDSQVIVVNKPAGLVVHPGAGRPVATLVNGLLARFPDIADIGDRHRPGIVHRLDATTSGLLVVARSGDAYDHLVDALAARTVMRLYTAVSHGVAADDRGVIDAPIGRSSRRRTKMAVAADGRDAVTHYEVIDRRYDGPAATLLRCRLETGRTHQIRVHLAAIGHPVVGDVIYGASRDGLTFDRVALHATELAFSHPVTGETMHFVQPPPTDMATLINSLGLSSDESPD